MGVEKFTQALRVVQRGLTPVPGQLEAMAEQALLVIRDLPFDLLAVDAAVLEPHTPSLPDELTCDALASWHPVFHRLAELGFSGVPVFGEALRLPASDFAEHFLSECRLTRLFRQQALWVSSRLPVEHLRLETFHRNEHQITIEVAFPEGENLYLRPMDTSYNGFMETQFKLNDQRFIIDHHYQDTVHASLEYLQEVAGAMNAHKGHLEGQTDNVYRSTLHDAVADFVIAGEPLPRECAEVLIDIHQLVGEFVSVSSVLHQRVSRGLADYAEALTNVQGMAAALRNLPEGSSCADHFNLLAAGLAEYHLNRDIAKNLGSYSHHTIEQTISGLNSHGETGQVSEIHQPAILEHQLSARLSDKGPELGQAQPINAL